MWSLLMTTKFINSSYFKRVFYQLNDLAIHGKRVTIRPEDIQIWGRITGTQTRSQYDN